MISGQRDGSTLRLYKVMEMTPCKVCPCILRTPGPNRVFITLHVRSCPSAPRLALANQACKDFFSLLFWGGDSLKTPRLQTASRVVPSNHNTFLVLAEKAGLLVRGRRLRPNWKSCGAAGPLATLR